jgi:hypothetical protein
MITSLVNVIRSAQAYRATVDRIFSEPLVEPDAASEYFFDLSISVSQLHLDYILVVKDQPAIERFVALGDHQMEKIRSDRDREMGLQERLEQRLEELPCWEYFDPSDAFADYTGLRTLKDYITSFVIQLPEAYEESFRAESYAKSLLAGTSGPIEELIVCLEHMGRNHLSFVRFATEGAAERSNWRVPGVAADDAKNLGRLTD